MKYPTFPRLAQTIITLLFLALFSSGHARETQGALSFSDNPRRGWHFYEIPPEPPKEEKEKVTVAQPRKSPELDPQEQLKAYQKIIEDAKATAIMDPFNEKKVMRYMQLQQHAMNKSAGFADTWQRVLWATPSLDETLKHPVNTVGSWVDRDAKSKAKQRAVRNLAKTNGLFFFFKSSCAYCVAQAPILRAFASQHNLNVMAVSLDGSELHEFPNAKMDNGISERFGVKDMPSPAIYMVNPSTGTITALSFGLVTEAELSERIYTLTVMPRGEF